MRVLVWGGMLGVLACGAGTLRAEPAATAARGEALPPVKAAPSAKKTAPSQTTLEAKVDLTAQRLTVSSGDAVRHSWPISSGREGFATPRGSYRPQWTSKIWYSRKYDNAPMPHAVFFTGGVAIHGTQSTGQLGSPASHGCVRLAPAHAAIFYALVQKHGLGHTRIEVFGTPPPSRVARALRPKAGMPVAGPVPASQTWFGGALGWGGPKGQAREPATRAAAVVRRGPDGRIHVPPGSRLSGRRSFVLNGVTYVRVP